MTPQGEPRRLETQRLTHVAILMAVGADAGVHDITARDRGV